MVAILPEGQGVAARDAGQHAGMSRGIAGGKHRPLKRVHSATGLDMVESMLAVFREVTPLMNLTMQIGPNEGESKEEA